MAALTLALAAPAMAEVPPTLKKVGGWEIFIDSTTNGCSMLVGYKNGLFAYILLTGDRGFESVFLQR
jgi:hypothetical protein